jgi:molecular chaperone GrpE
MQTKGEPFNVDYHDALMQRKDDSVPPHTVLDEIEPGYLYRDKVIRHAKVIVSEESSDENNSVSNQSSSESENEN